MLVKVWIWTFLWLIFTTQLHVQVISYVKETKGVVVLFYFFLGKRRCAVSEVANYKIGAGHSAEASGDLVSLVKSHKLAVTLPCACACAALVPSSNPPTLVVHKLGPFMKKRNHSHTCTYYYFITFLAQSLSGFSYTVGFSRLSSPFMIMRTSYHLGAVPFLLGFRHFSLLHLVWPNRPTSRRFKR